MVKSAPAFSWSGCQVRYASAIPVVPAGSYTGSILQKEKIKRHTANKPNATTNNENTDTLATMAQPAATLSLPIPAIA